MTSATNSRTPTTNRSLPNSWHNPYNYQRFQYQLQLQVAVPRLLQKSKSRSHRRPHYTDKVVSYSYNPLHPRFPHTDAMVLTVHIDRWDVSKILVDNGSQTEILFLSTFEKWVMKRSNSRNQRSPSMASAAKESSLSE
jgi:hypothetical protein